MNVDNQTIKTVKSTVDLAKMCKSDLVNLLDISRKKHGNYHHFNINQLIKEEQVDMLKAGLLQSRIELVLSKTELSNEIGFYHLLEVSEESS